jgi:hypothetical protein
MAGPPTVVSVGPPWALFEDRSIIDYIDLQGNAAATGAGETAVVAKFGRVPPWGNRPVIGIWPSNAAAVTVALTGDGITTPWSLVATSVAALAAGVRANAPVKILYQMGSN